MNSQVQTQEKKLLTLTDIAPKWSQLFDILEDNRNLPFEEKVIIVTDFYRKHNIEMVSTKHCVVGEAYHGDGDYYDNFSPKYCKECRDFACSRTGDEDFVGLKLNLLYNHISDWKKDRRVKAFEAHWNKDHEKS